MKNRDEMINELKKNVCRVVFTKKNGDERDMSCTLLPSYLPEAKGTESKKAESKTDSISVFDVNANGWRAFNVSNVTLFETKK